VLSHSPTDRPSVPSAPSLLPLSVIRYFRQGLKPVSRHALPLPLQSHHFNTYDRAAGTSSLTLLSFSARPLPLPKNTIPYHSTHYSPAVRHRVLCCAVLCLRSVAPIDLLRSRHLPLLLHHNSYPSTTTPQYNCWRRAQCTVTLALQSITSLTSTPNDLVEERQAATIITECIILTNILRCKIPPNAYLTIRPKMFRRLHRSGFDLHHRRRHRQSGYQDHDRCRNDRE
jgi:hypothetical protein